jgi:hypothetical protein
MRSSGEEKSLVPYQVSTTKNDIESKEMRCLTEGRPFPVEIGRSGYCGDRQGEEEVELTMKADVSDDSVKNQHRN